MHESIEIDRFAIRGMVEDFWRSFIALGKQHPQIAIETVARFEERVRSTSALMEPEQAALFLKTVDEERDMLFKEYQRNPEALKQRLGLPHPTVTPVLHVHQRQSLGEAAARTAVRATVRASIFALFRLFR